MARIFQRTGHIFALWTNQSSLLHHVTKRHASEHESVQRLRQYLKINTSHPDVDYTESVVFLKNEGESMGLPVSVQYPHLPNKPVVLITWKGSSPDLPSVLLNSHMDVVPVFEDKWAFGPFSAHKDEKGNIFARGAQDTKALSIQHMEAVRRLKEKGVSLKRTVHVSMLPDEELGGDEGMAKWSQSDEFKNLNVGVAFDEGGASEDNKMYVRYGERSIWQVNVHCSGTSGHGSLLLQETPGEKLNHVIHEFFQVRNNEVKRLRDSDTLQMGDITSINLTMVKGGVQRNVIPPEFVASFDIRLAINNDFEKFEKWIQTVCEQAGPGVHPKFKRKEDSRQATALTDSNVYWVAFKKAADDLGLQLVPTISTGGTDARYLRRLGIPAFGFSPMPHTPNLAHGHNEFINEKVFLDGIGIFEHIITQVANV